MDNSNIIISVIIVLCIAAGVTAYGISEGDNAVFSDLAGFSPDSSNSGDNGIGNITANNSGGSGSSPVATTSSGGSSGSASSGSGSNGGNGNGGGNNNGQPQQPSRNVTPKVIDIGYEASYAKAVAAAGSGATFDHFVETSNARIFYFNKHMEPSEQSESTSDSFGIMVTKKNGAVSLY